MNGILQMWQRVLRHLVPPHLLHSGNKGSRKLMVVCTTQHLLDEKKSVIPLKVQRRSQHLTNTTDYQGRYEVELIQHIQNQLTKTLNLYHT